MSLFYTGAIVPLKTIFFGILSTSLVFTDRLYHRVGAAATNALSPKDLVFITG